MPAKSLLFWLAGEVSWLAVEVLSMVKIKVRISETKYCSFYKTLPKPLVMLVKANKMTIVKTI